MLRFHETLHLMNTIHNDKELYHMRIIFSFRQKGRGLSQSHLITIMNNLFVGRDLLITSLLLQVPLVQQVILKATEKKSSASTRIFETKQVPYGTMFGQDRNL